MYSTKDSYGGAGAYDVVVAGAGLAGASAAFWLSASARVLVLDARHPAAGASGVAAGLVNPLMGVRARPVWRMDEAREALAETLDAARAGALWRGPCVLRPAADPAQAAAFRRSADERPELATYLEGDESVRRFPAVLAPHGALAVTAGGAVDVPALVARLLAAAAERGATVLHPARITGWHEETSRVVATVEAPGGPQHVATRRLLLAPGGDYAVFPALAALRLHPVKGQTVHVLPPEGLRTEDLPPLSGARYVVPGGGVLVVGSTYEHQFTDARPTAAAEPALLAQAARMLPALAGARVASRFAGIRVNVPGTRLPMIGPLPGSEGVWVFTGLGSRGLLMAPLLARTLGGYLADPSRIPPEVRVRLR